MKRLLISSLLGCMLMSQANAADFKSLVTQDNAVALAKGAGIALAPLALRGVAAMGICAPVEKHYGVSRNGFSSLSYILPTTNIIQRALADGINRDWCERLKSSVHPIPTAEADTIKLNRWTAFISALLCGASMAKLCGILPESVSKFMGSQITTAGIAAGSAFSVALLLPSFKKFSVPA